MTEKRKKMTEASASVCFIMATALHAYCNSERPVFHELITNGVMKFLLRVVSPKHNLPSMTFLVSAEIPVTNACAALVVLIFSVEGFVIPCEKQLKCMLI